MNAASTRMRGETFVGTSASKPPSPAVALSCDPLATIETTVQPNKRTAPIEASAVSDTTMSSSDRFSSSSDSDALDDDYGAHLLVASDESENEGESEALATEQTSYMNEIPLVKPMPSRLQVCPVDDLAVEDEKRRRRLRRNLKNKSTNKTTLHTGASRDAGSLPLASMVRTRRSGSSPGFGTLARRAICHRRPSSVQERRPTRRLPDGATLGAPASLLRKDSAELRRQYWSQLGFSLSRHELEKSTGRKKERREGLKVRLNDANSAQADGAKRFFRFITSWYAPLTAVCADEKSLLHDKERTASARQVRSSLSRGSAALSCSATANTPKKSVHFHEEAELFYIPLHRDYSKRQRECMWPTRVEFVAMVERNLDAVYDEMEREFEAQLETEYVENDGMAREEARQRTVVSQQRKVDDTAHAAAQSRCCLSSPLSRSSSVLSSVPTLTLLQKQVLVSPRARSSYDLRFKYLKHLGIDS